MSASLSLRQIGQVFLLRSKGPLGDDATISFHTAIFQFLPAISDNKAEIARSPLAAFGVKMDIVMHDILMRDDFLEEPQRDIDRFIHNTTALLGTVRSGSGNNNVESKQALKRIGKRVPEVVQHLWDNRDRLNIRNPEIKAMRNNPICVLLLTYHAQAENTSRILSQFLLYCWVFAPHPGAELGELLYLHANHSITCQANSEVEAIHEAYLKNAILEAIGPDAFILRVNKELQRPKISQEHLASCLSVVHDLERLEDFGPYIQKHKLMDVMLQTMETYSTAQDTHYRTVVYSHVAGFLRACAAQFCKALSTHSPADLVVPGEHVISYIARGVDLAADENVDFGSGSTDLILEDIRFYSLFALKIASIGKDPPSLQFLEGLRVGARAVWWPCLTRLQVAHYRTKGIGPHGVLLERWTELGTALGLDEVKERKRHRKEERVFCSWPSCKFNTERPLSKLSTCQGCGEAQYCGKVCQRSDWNRGGHKKRCGTRIQK
ncbi:hypothetical protein PENSPDRAFT_752412 [Peniophora sp. CONT]|nr:hypothetical protein PENSPDRAFT_752412 [Peniophora sp. CONT]